MARNVSIPITDHNDGDSCTTQYNLRLRLTSTDAWQALAPQYDSPIVLDNLNDDVEYQLGVTRVCCDANPSAETFITFTTTVSGG